MSLKDIESMTQELANILMRFKRISLSKNKNHEIRSSEILVLFNLYQLLKNEPGGVKVSQLSNHLQITPGAVTHIINALFKKKYVERLNDEKDRRIVLVKISTNGLNALKNMKLKFFNKCEKLLNHLGEDDGKTFIRLLNEVLDFFEKNKNIGN